MDAPHLPLRVHGPQISAGERLSFDLGAYRNHDVRMGKRAIPCERTTRRVCWVVMVEKQCERGPDPCEGLGLPAEESGFGPIGHESWVTKRVNGLEPTALSSVASMAPRPWDPDALRLEDAVIAFFLCPPGRLTRHSGRL